MSDWFGNLHPSLRRAWHPVCREEELADGPVAVQLVGEWFVLFRSGDAIAALPDRCPHRFAPLSAGRVVGDELECAYHGYRFARDGRCTAVPALGDGAAVPPKAHLTAPHGVRVALGLVWMAIDPPVHDGPVAVAEWDDPSFVRAPLPPQVWRAGAAQMVDNFLDVAHFPFTHAGTFGDPADTAVEPYDVSLDGPGFSVRSEHTARSIRDSVTVVHRVQEFTYAPPLTVTLRILYVEDGVTLTICFCHQPMDEGMTRLYITDLRNDLDGSPESIAGAIDYQAAVGAEDQGLLERLRVKAVPLDLTAEVHTRADRITVELRRALARFAEAAEAT